MGLKTLAAVAALLTLSVFPQTSKAAQPEKEWTFLVYINGHNSLDSYGALDINEMEKVGTTDQANVVVQWASTKAKTTKRLLIKKDNDPNKVTSPVVQDMARVDMGDPKSLVDFVKWAHDNYPAKHYYISVWNHGSGWHGRELNSNFHFWNISYDDISGNSIDTFELGLAMEESAKIIGHKVDVYGSDACLMGMIEVAHQMKDSVSYFVGSEDLEPGEGWPYDTLLAQINKLGAQATPAEVSKILPQLYTQAYPGQDVTMSAFDLSQIDALTTALSNLRVVMNNSTTNNTALSTAISGSLKFYYEDYVDLGDFLNKLKSRMSSPENDQYINSVQTELNNVVIANSAQGSFQLAQGLSIWLPSSSTYSQHSADYSKLSFDVTAQWHKLIEQSF